MYITVKQLREILGQRSSLLENATFNFFFKEQIENKKKQVKLLYKHIKKIERTVLELKSRMPNKGFWEIVLDIFHISRRV